MQSINHNTFYSSGDCLIDTNWSKQECKRDKKEKK